MERRKDIKDSKRVETFCVKLESGDKSIEISKSGNVLINFNKLDFIPPDSINKVVLFDGYWYDNCQFYYDLSTNILSLYNSNPKITKFEYFFIYFHSKSQQRNKIINDLLG